MTAEAKAAAGRESDLPISMARMAIDMLHRSPGWFYVRRKTLESFGFPKQIPVLKSYLPSGIRWAIDHMQLHHLKAEHKLCYEIDTYVPWADQKKAPASFSPSDWESVPGVYLVSFATFLKIGVSNNIAGRLRCLQRNLPETLVFHGAIIGADQSDERDMHRKFAEHRRNGEWFTLAPEILAYIEGAKMGGKKP